MKNEKTGETDGRGKPLPYDIEGASGETVGAGLAPPDIPLRAPGDALPPFG